jgi:hypothetical protein
MVLFAIAVLAVAAMLALSRLVARSMNQECRYRCTCVADSAALGALASIVGNRPSGHAR